LTIEALNESPALFDKIYLTMEFWQKNYMITALFAENLELQQDIDEIGFVI